MKKARGEKGNYPTLRMSKVLLRRLIKYLKEKEKWDSDRIIKLIEYLTTDK